MRARNRIQVVGAGLKTQKSYSTIHYIDDFEKKVQIIYGVEGPRFSANAKRSRLALKATRIRMSYEFDAYMQWIRTGQKNIELRKGKAREGNEEVCTHFLDSESELRILSIRTLISQLL